MSRKAVIFDLDGVIVSTDECHYQAWRKIADEEEIPFNREINQRLRGVSRLESLEIILENSRRSYTDEEKAVLASKKNACYRKLLEQLQPSHLLPGVQPLLQELREYGILTAIGSSSQNARFILDKIGLSDAFDAVVDGNAILTGKPDPEVFLLAARELGVKPEECVVIEDADSGIEAALAAGMAAIGVSYAAVNRRAHVRINNLSCIRAQDIMRL